MKEIQIQEIRAILRGKTTVKNKPHVFDSHEYKDYPCNNCHAPYNDVSKTCMEYVLLNKVTSFKEIYHSNRLEL